MQASTQSYIRMRNQDLPELLFYTPSYPRGWRFDIHFFCSTTPRVCNSLGVPNSRTAPYPLLFKKASTYKYSSTRSSSLEGQLSLLQRVFRGERHGRNNLRPPPSSLVFSINFTSIVPCQLHLHSTCLVRTSPEALGVPTNASQASHLLRTLLVLPDNQTQTTTISSVCFPLLPLRHLFPLYLCLLLQALTIPMK